jgi:hypothetical protein
MQVFGWKVPPGHTWQCAALVMGLVALPYVPAAQHSHAVFMLQPALKEPSWHASHWPWDSAE